MLKRPVGFTTRAGCAALILAFSITPVFAQSQPDQNSTGTTSGPAAGSNVEPSTATQKHSGHKPSVGTGSAGVAAKKGSESGAKPDKSSPH
jgi:hypothetical protein